MERRDLGLADDSLFIDQFNRTFRAADTDLPTRVHAFLLEKALEVNSNACKAASLLTDQGAGALTIAGALLIPVLRQGLTDFVAIRERFDTDVSTVPEDLYCPPHPDDNTQQLQPSDVHGLLSFMGGEPRKAFLKVFMHGIHMLNRKGFMSRVH
jgi:hypothetical protein